MYAKLQLCFALRDSTSGTPATGTRVREDLVVSVVEAQVVDRIPSRPHIRTFVTSFSSFLPEAHT